MARRGRPASTTLRTHVFSEPMGCPYCLTWRGGRSKFGNRPVRRCPSIRANGPRSPRASARASSTDPSRSLAPGGSRFGDRWRRAFGGCAAHATAQLGLHTIAVCQARDHGPGNLHVQWKLAEKRTENEARRASNDVSPTSYTATSVEINNGVSRSLLAHKVSTAGENWIWPTFRDCVLYGVSLQAS